MIDKIQSEHGWPALGWIATKMLFGSTGFQHDQQCRRVATRYDKLAANFLPSWLPPIGTASRRR